MEPGSEFNFQNLPNYKFSSLEDITVKEKLAKWSMIDGLKLQAFAFDKPFQKYNDRDFVMSFLGCQNVSATLLTANLQHGFLPVGVPAEVVKFSEVKCTLTTLDIFEKLKSGGQIVRPNGSIVKCLPHYVRPSDGSMEDFEIEIADNLRKVILSDFDEDDFSEINDGIPIFTESDKKEFLYSLFSHFVVGGSLCQYEDNIEPYTMMTKLFYKDLVAVAASGAALPASGGSRGAGDGDENRKLVVISHVYKVHLASNENKSDGKKNLLFNRNYYNNFFYLIINPLKQVCFTLYHHV